MINPCGSKWGILAAPSSESSPLGSISYIFEVENVLLVVDPLGQTSKITYFHRKRLDSIEKRSKQAGAELGQAQLQLGLDFNSID